uniref:Uncharacterized protein n=1 Tax=Anguilla anguilla TaxID=7936 RepID=A0A0E9WGG8_ANGAN
MMYYAVKDSLPIGVPHALSSRVFSRVLQFQTLIFLRGNWACNPEVAGLIPMYCTAIVHLSQVLTYMLQQLASLKDISCCMSEYCVTMLCYSG